MIVLVSDAVRVVIVKDFESFGDLAFHDISRECKVGCLLTYRGGKVGLAFDFFDVVSMNHVVGGQIRNERNCCLGGIVQSNVLSGCVLFYPS